MIPVVKGWCTETSIDVASTGIQIQGGMGYVEETGAAQYWRDARITTIYEGTTGIQANDLIGRKIAREKGITAQAVIAAMKATDGQLAEAPGTDFSAIRAVLSEGVKALDEATGWIVATYSSDVKAASAGAVPFLKLFGIVAGGWQMARAALVAQAKLSAGDDGNDSLIKPRSQPPASTPITFSPRRRACGMRSSVALRACWHWTRSSSNGFSSS